MTSPNNANSQIEMSSESESTHSPASTVNPPNTLPQNQNVISPVSTITVSSDTSSIQTMPVQESAQNANTNLSVVPVENPENVRTTGPSNELQADNCSQLNTPRNLQELLRLSTSLQTNNEGGESESAPQPMDDERARFLREALSGLTVDLVAELKKKIEIISSIKPQPNQTELEHYENIIDELIEQIDPLDFSNIFYQLGGLEAVLPLLTHERPALRWRAASIIAECCKNNPFCQSLSTTDAVFEALMALAKSDTDLNAKFKSMSAISAIIRDNMSGVAMFRKHNGFEMLRDNLNSRTEKIVSKAAFMIQALCSTDTSTKADLMALGFIETLISLVILTENWMAEYFLHALAALMKDYLPAIEEADREEMGLRKYLVKILNTKNDDESYQEAMVVAKELLKLLDNKGKHS